jgi:hypothetical protein
VRVKGSKLGEPCPKVRLSQDRLPILHTNVVHLNVASSKCHSTVKSFKVQVRNFDAKNAVEKKMKVQQKQVLIFDCSLLFKNIWAAIYSQKYLRFSYDYYVGMDREPLPRRSLTTIGLLV